MPFTTTLSVLEFIVLCGLCTAEVAGFRWRELDVEDDCWRIPAERMKSRKEHYLPSSAPTFALLPALDSERTAYELVLPSGAGAVIWNGTFSHQLCKMGYARAGVHTRLSKLAQELACRADDPRRRCRIAARTTNAAKFSKLTNAPGFMKNKRR